jgi:hypothetical protein
MSELEFYGASPLKRERATKAEVEQLERQIWDVLSEDHPQSVRHVFYRMTDPRLPRPVEKSEKGYVQVQRRILEMRRRGVLPYGWIVDHTRAGFHVNTYQNKAHFLRSIAGLYRADLWAQAHFYCEVWCESRSIAGVVLADCRELAVSLYPTGGFASASLGYAAAEVINDYCDGRPVVIFYIGDYDPAGVLIDVSAERELRPHLAADVELDFRRLAITLEQIEEYDLPTKPRKVSDRRMLEIESTVEAEAMPAGILRQLLRDEIEALLPPRALEVARAAEASERMDILSLAGAEE